MSVNKGKFDSGLKSARTSLGSFVTGVGGAHAALLKFGGVLAAGFGLHAVAGAIGGVVKKASDLQEATNKAKAVFGDAFGTVADDTQRLADKFGLVKSEMLDAKANFGQLAQGIGLSDQKSGEFANTFAKLAADLTSFQNIPFGEALIKLQAALAGETEPLARLGVDVREAATQQYAWTHGIATAGAALTQQQKTMARSGLIQERLSVVSGDLDRTIGDFANNSRAAEGRLENLQATIGQAILPAFNDFKTLLNEVLVDFTTSHSGMQSALETFTGYARSAIQFVGVVYRNWGDLVQITSLTVQEKLINVGELFSWLGDAAGKVATWFYNDWRNILADAFNGVWTVASNVFNNIKGLWQATLDFFNNPSGGFKFEFTPLLDGFGEAMSTLPEIAKPHLTSLQAEIDAIGAGIADRESARAGGAAAHAEAVKKVALGPEVKKGKAHKHEKEFSAAMELGSAEARSTVIRASLGLSGKDAAQATAKNTAKQVEQNDRVIGLLRQNLAGAGGIPVVAL